jgi:nucleotide-binding universal stress UspA family protein
MSVIVVGLDMSPASRAALEWTARYARLVGARVRALHALVVPPEVAVAGVMGRPADPVPAGNIEASYREAVGRIWDSVRPESDWRLEFYLDEPGPMLARHSVGAQLLVLGTQEHVGLARLVAPSVSHYCVRHASCPVVAVPEPDPSQGQPLAVAVAERS